MTIRYVAVSIWELGFTCAKKTMALVHLLYYSAVSYNINICIVHIVGVNNEIADCLSHFNLTLTLCSGITNGLLQAPESVFSGIHLAHIK